MLMPLSSSEGGGIALYGACLLHYVPMKPRDGAPSPGEQREASAQARELRDRRAKSAIESAPAPVIDAEFIHRHLARHEMTAKDLATLMLVTPAAVGQWMAGRPIPMGRQRELMDLFGAPMRLQDATLDELIREVVRRAMGGR